MSHVPFDHPVALSLDSLLRGGLGALKDGIIRALKRDDYSEALKIANEAYAEAGATDLNAALTYAVLLNHRDLGQESLGVLRKALTHHAHAPEIQLAQVEALLAREDFDAAVDLMEALESLTFQDPRHIAYLGDLFLDVGDEDKALRAYEQALLQGCMDAGVATNVAQIYLERAETQKAAEAFEQAARLAPSDYEIWATTGDTWLGLEEWDRAVKAYRRATHLESEDAQSWMYLGVALSGKGELEEALDAFKTAQKLDPLEPVHWLNVGHMQLELGYPEEASRSYEEVTALEPSNPEAVAGMTAAAFEVGDVEMAEKMGRRAIELDPGNPDAHFNLGIIELSMGRNERARIEFEAALEIVPFEPRYMLSMAIVELRAGRIDDALATVEKAVAGGNDDATGLYEFGRDLFRYGGAESVLNFVASTESLDPRWNAIQPVFEYLSHSLRRDIDAARTRRYVDAVIESVRSFPELIPIMWDFEELERLGLGLDTQERRLFEMMLAVLEGRKSADALTALAA